MERFRTFESVFVMAAIGGTGMVSEFLKQQLECFLSTLKKLKINVFYQFLTIFLDFWIFLHFALLTVAA